MVSLATAVGDTLEMSPSQGVLQQDVWSSLYTNPKGMESIPVGAGAPLRCGIKGKGVTHGVTEMKHIKKPGRRAQTHIIALEL